MSNIIYIVGISWILAGLTGYILYCLNSNTRPSKKLYLLVALFTHIFFGFIGLLYGYICFSSRNNIKSISNV